MRRNMDLLRNILLKIDSEQPDSDGTYEFGWEDVGASSYREFVEHFRQLIEKRYVRAIDQFTEIEDTALCTGMTSDGHDFLDSIRDNEIWENTKSSASSAGGWTLDILADLAKGFVKTQIKKHTNVEI
ncbi:MAG: DUF2513 domain-containing protein [Bosea sp. (in: a-proteobacteria)]